MQLDSEALLSIMRSLGIGSMPMDLELYSMAHFFGEQSELDSSTLSRLRSGELIDENGRIDPDLENWLRILEHPDITASAISRINNRVRRVVIARRGPHHVVAMRIGNEILIQAIQCNSRNFEEVVAAPLWDSLRLSETLMDPPAARMNNITWVSSLGDLKGNPSTLPIEIQQAMETQGPTKEVLQELFGTNGQRAQIFIEQRQKTDEMMCCPAVVLVADTRFGRVIMGTRKDRVNIVATLGGGSYKRFKSAIGDLIAMTPSQDWFSGAS